MILYNITTKVHAAVDAAWLQWTREEHIAETMATGLFTSYKLLHLLDHDDAEGKTYAVQYTADSAGKYHQYINNHATLLRKKAVEKWGAATISFHSALEVIQ